MHYPPCMLLFRFRYKNVMTSSASYRVIFFKLDPPKVQNPLILGQFSWDLELRNFRGVQLKKHHPVCHKSAQRACLVTKGFSATIRKADFIKYPLVHDYKCLMSGLVYSRFQGNQSCYKAGKN